MSRPSVSMKRRFYRWLRFAAERQGISGSELIQRAIKSYCERWWIPEPPEDWSPPKGKGRPLKRRADDDPGAHFTF